MCGSESITSMGVALFDTVPPDLMGFGLGSSFNARYMVQPSARVCRVTRYEADRELNL
jgi:hypothetical protein